MAVSSFDFPWAILIGLLCSIYLSQALGIDVSESTSYENCLPRTCKDVVGAEPRVVTILWDGLEVLCDTQTDGGGWLVIQRRVDGSVDFYRYWDEYKYGFGNITDEFWFGNEKIHGLTTQRRYELRVDFKFQGKDYYASYSHFRVFGEAEKYKLEISGYYGNAGDNLSYSNYMAFSTKDRDNDRIPESCAQIFYGAWWYDACHRTNLNGAWGSKIFGKGLNWYNTTDLYDSATFTEMKIRPLPLTKSQEIKTCEV